MPGASGDGRFTIADKEIAVAAGDVAIIPRDTPHDHAGRPTASPVHAPANLDEADHQPGRAARARPGG
ncbi:cupin domain-containing protein [Geminicoccus flavidas]|uniref:cupin domain-containing protein n=1 Tax=Geminicoccus flavidas TaxID=2506407 RepID=UPI00135AC5F6|nr:cupin domain-containing protein [Geminicoccus flavidas]